MEHPAGEAPTADLRLGFDRRLKLEFHGSEVTSDAGLLAFRELDDALGLTELAGQSLADTRTGRNGRYTLSAQVRQAIFGRIGRTTWPTFCALWPCRMRWNAGR